MYVLKEILDVVRFPCDSTPKTFLELHALVFNVHSWKQIMDDKIVYSLVSLTFLFILNARRNWKIKI